MSSRKVDHRYLQQLSKRQEQIDEKMRESQKKQKDVCRVFLDHVGRQLDLLTSEKDRMAERNETYLSEIRSYTKEFNKVLPELMEAEDKLAKAKLQYQRALEKQLK